MAEGDEREDFVAARVWDRVMGADDDDVDDGDVLAAVVVAVVVAAVVVVVVAALTSIAAGRFSKEHGGWVARLLISRTTTGSTV